MHPVDDVFVSMTGRQLTPQQKALAQAAREAEALVLAKMRCQDYIILCVEDTTDWKHATTRNIVMQVHHHIHHHYLPANTLTHPHKYTITDCPLLRSSACACCS